MLDSCKSESQDLIAGMDWPLLGMVRHSTH